MPPAGFGGPPGFREFFTQNENIDIEVRRLIMLLQASRPPFPPGGGFGGPPGMMGMPGGPGAPPFPPNGGMPPGMGGPPPGFSGVCLPLMHIHELF